MASQVHVATARRGDHDGLAVARQPVMTADGRDIAFYECLVRLEREDGSLLALGDAIRAAVEDAEESADVDIGRVLVTLDGEHIKGIDSRGVVAVSRSGGEIARAEVSAVLDAAKTLALPGGRTILDAKAQEFFVDGQRGIRDPIGMSGVRLGSKVHIVTASQQA